MRADPSVADPAPAAWRRFAVTLVAATGLLLAGYLALALAVDPYDTGRPRLLAPATACARRDRAPRRRAGAATRPSRRRSSATRTSSSSRRRACARPPASRSCSSRCRHRSGRAAPRRRLLPAPPSARAGPGARGRFGLVHGRSGLAAPEALPVLAARRRRDGLPARAPAHPRRRREVSTASAGPCARPPAGRCRTATGITSRTTSPSALPTDRAGRGSAPGAPRTTPTPAREPALPSRGRTPARPGAGPRSRDPARRALPARPRSGPGPAGHAPGSRERRLPRGPRGSRGAAGPHRRLVRRTARIARPRPVLRRHPLPPAARPADRGRYRCRTAGLAGGRHRSSTTVTRLPQGAAVPGPLLAYLPSEIVVACSLYYRAAPSGPRPGHRPRS